MATGITKYGDINQRTATYAMVDMLAHAEPRLILSKLGMTKPVPKNKADNVTFRRYKPFAVSTVPLAEGVTPSPQMLETEDVPVQLHQYGNVVVVTDWVADTSEDPVLKETSILIGEQAAGTAEQVIYNAIKGGSNAVFANGTQRSDVNTAITINKLRAATRALDRQKARKITRILGGSPNYETKPVQAAYVAVCHTDCEADIRGLAGFIPTAEYGTRQTISEHEFGSVENVRFVTSPDLAPFADAGGAKGSMVSTSGTNADVYPILIFGQDAFAAVPLKGENALTPIVVNAKPSDSDPLAQRNQIGYKFAMGSVILNELWLVRLEVAVTNL